MNYTFNVSKINMMPCLGNSNGTNDTDDCFPFDIDWTAIYSSADVTKSPVLQAGKDFFAYFTPVILLVGIVGNSLSLNVFMSKNMRSLSASTYLAALSTADISTLIFYVSIEWLRRGLVHIAPDTKYIVTVLDTNGVCQTLLFLSYISRLMSSWLIVIFTIERYLGVCHPLKRRGDPGSSKGTKRLILGLLFVCCLAVIYKPVMSGGYTIRGRTACASKPEYKDISFILDSGFAILITLIPFVIITVLNLLIVRKLFLRNKLHKESSLFTEESTIRLEFTLILLAISFFFVAFNLPYFVIWFRNFLYHKFIYSSPATDDDYWNGVVIITRTIFYMNYCINFFLYSITGVYFRRELKALFVFRFRRSNKNNSSYIRIRRLNSSNSTQTTMIHSRASRYST